MFSEYEIQLVKLEINMALEDYATAIENLENKRYRAALNRSYYSIFHIMCTRLNLDGLEFSKHSAVIAKFRELYLNTENFESNLRKKLSDIIKITEDLRNGSDYDKGFIVNSATVEKSLEDVKFFNDTLLEYINGLINKNQ